MAGQSAAIFEELPDETGNPLHRRVIVSLERFGHLIAAHFEFHKGRLQALDDAARCVALHINRARDFHDDLMSRIPPRCVAGNDGVIERRVKSRECVRTAIHAAMSA